MSSGVSPAKNGPPSFSSFPLAPAFDSFPVATTSQAAHDESEVARQRKHGSRRDDERHSLFDGRPDGHRASRDGGRRRSLSPETERDKSTTHLHRERRDRDGGIKERHSQSKREGHKRHREPRRRHRSSSADSENQRSSKSHLDKYNVPNLAYGELARVVGQAPRESDPALIDEPDYKLFALDRKGDQDVRKYGKPYQGSIPRYRRTGYGHIIGLPGEYRITLDSARAGDRLHVIAGKDLSQGAALHDRAVRNRITDRRFKRLILAPSIKAIQSTTDSVIRLDVDTSFIPLPKVKSTHDKIAELEHETGQDYRSVAGAVKASDVTEGDNDAWADLDEAHEEGAENFDEYIKRRNTEFERELRRNPEDVQMWLQLVAFQESVHNFTSDGATKAAKRIISQISRRSLAEIKISIIERALSIPGNEDATALHLALLQYGAEIWDTKELMRRWMGLLKAKPDELEVWLAYITFRQTNATVFSVQGVLEVYTDCLQRLVRQILRAPRSSPERARLEENCVYLFLRACLLLRQASYFERALAAFQAMLELNFFIPDIHRADMQARPAEMTSVSNALDALEEYWDSEEPRIGEAGACGWKNLQALGGSSDAKEIVPEDGRLGRDTNLDPFELWAYREKASARSRRRPTKTTDKIQNEDDDDPYSTILFSDIRSLLFVVSSPDARSQLLYSFLFYLGLPLIPPDTSTTSRLSSDTFLHADDLSPSFAAKARSSFWPTQGADEFLRGLIPFDVIGGQAMDPVRTSAVRDPFSLPFKKFPLSPDVIFQSTSRWFCLLDLRHSIADLDLSLIRNALTQLRHVSKDIFLTLIHFSLEAAISPKGAVKVAKSTLKVDSKNLLLWDAYARIENSNGNLKAARNVYHQALSLSQAFDDKDKVDMPLLWRAWAELEWENGRPEAALSILVTSGSASTNAEDLKYVASGQEIAKPAPTTIMRALHHHKRMLDLANAPDSPQALFRHRISITYCLALLEYLTTGLQACQTVMSRQIAVLRSESRASAEEEEALAVQAKFAFRYSQSRTAYRPGTIRDIVESALETFPNNSIFLSLHLFNEVRTRMDNRVRRVLDDVILREDKVTAEGWLFAMYAEMHLNSRTYNPQSVRALFERATDHSKTKSSVSIWSLYIEFEVRQGLLKRAKTLLHRALVECPWAKDLYMMPFSAPLRSAYKSKELRELHRLMLEKGIRMYASLESDGWRSEVSEDEEDQDARETEDSLYAQKTAAERLRLLPM